MKTSLENTVEETDSSVIENDLSQKDIENTFNKTKKKFSPTKRKGCLSNYKTHMEHQTGRARKENSHKASQPNLKHAQQWEDIKNRERPSHI